MRILFITRKFPPSHGGMETYSKQLYEAFREIGANVHLHKPSTDLIGRPSLRQVVGFVLSTCWMLLRKGRKFDAILIGDYAISSLAIVAKLATFGRVRVVVSLHGNDLYFMRKLTPLAGLYRMLSRCVVASKSLDAAVANSHAISDEAAHRGIFPVSIIPLATEAPADTEWHTTVRMPRIIFTGRLIQYKGLSWFVREVWPHLSDSMEMLVAGQVWDIAERECLIDQPGITYMGSLTFDELAPLRATAIATIMPNVPPKATEQDEGFGLVALESPAVGTPTVASRCGGIPDAIAEGITGFVLPPLDPAAWVECLKQIAAWSPEYRQGFAERARRHVIEHYNWRLVAQRSLTVLDPAQADRRHADASA